MFELSHYEYPDLRSHFGTLKRGEHIKYLSMAFIEQAVSMLSNVLNSKQVIRLNIQIMPIFNGVRKALADNVELRLEREKIKTKLDSQDKNMEIVFHYLDELIKKNLNWNQSPRFFFWFLI